MLGPSKMFGFAEDNLYMMGTGYGLMGFFDTFMLVFALPEMIDCVEQNNPNMTTIHKAKMVDYSSGLLTAFFGIGTVAAPLYGAHAGALVGYQYTCDGMALISLAIGIAYFLAADGKKTLKKSWTQWTADRKSVV